MRLRIDMSVWDRVVEAVNVAMNTEAAQIRDELRQACPKRTGETAKSFHIMKIGRGMENGLVGAKGLITSVQIGSTLPSAYFADQGNGERMIYPKKKKALKFSDGTFHAYARPYKGANFIEEVARNHR